MKIGTFAQRTGVPIDTLRYYDHIGLLSPKRTGGIRIYTEDDAKTMESIQALKSMQFTLDEIREIMTLDQAIDQSLTDESNCLETMTVIAHMLDGKYQALLKQEAALKLAKKQIKHIQEKVHDALEVSS